MSLEYFAPYNSDLYCSQCEDVHCQCNSCPDCGGTDVRVFETNYGDFKCNTCETEFTQFGNRAVKHPQS